MLNNTHSQEKDGAPYVDLASIPYEAVTREEEGEYDGKLAGKIKVLVVSFDRKVFDPESAVRQRMIEYGALFEQLHVIVYSRKRDGLHMERAGGNVWLYPTNSWTRFLYPWDALRIATKQISFKFNLHADIVSAQDPFEVGLGAYLIAKKFKRRLQLQVHADFLSPYFKDVDRLNSIRIRIAKHLLPKAQCVRVVSNFMKEHLEKGFPQLVGRIEVLPIFIDIQYLQNAQPKFDIHEKYPQFNFIILMASRLTKEKNIGLAIDVFASIVKTYSKAGLIIVGEGNEKGNLQSLVRRHGITDSVIFEPWQDEENLISYYKTANLFLLTSSYEGYGRAPIEAAACGIPIVTSDVGIVASVFREEKDKFICPVGDEGCFIQRILNFIERNESRLFFKFNVKEHIEDLVSETKEEYLLNFKRGMEQCLLKD